MTPFHDGEIHDAARALAKSIDAWLKETPESVQYPGPGDEEPLHEMLDAHEVLHDAGVFADDPADVRRVVIDLQAESAARVYIDRFVDSSLIDVLLSGAIEIVESDPAPEPLASRKAPA